VNDCRGKQMEDDLGMCFLKKKKKVGASKIKHLFFHFAQQLLMKNKIS